MITSRQPFTLSPPFPPRSSSSAEKETSKQHQSQPNPNTNALVCCVMALLPMLDNVKLHIALMRISMLHIPYTYTYKYMYIYVSIYLYIYGTCRCQAELSQGLCACACARLDALPPLILRITSLLLHSLIVSPSHLHCDCD